MADGKQARSDGGGADPAPGSDPVSDLLLELARSPERDPAELGAMLAPGDVVGRFELLRELGRGGFGVVFEARDRELGRLVAFKAMRPLRGGGKSLEQPLREEAEAAARLNHPNIVTLHDYGIHEGTPYLILERLHGETLQDRLKRGPLAPLEAVRLGMDVARGLVHAHAQGVIHRDLKPGNVFLCDGGGPKLLDFGLARLRGRAAARAAGTPAYMAPEQLRGAGEDARTDVFAAAVVLFQALSGELPYPTVRGRSAVLDPGPPPRLPVPDAPPELVALLWSALSKDPASRPQSAQALLDGLAAVERAYERLAQERALADRRARLRRLAFAAGAIALLGASGAAALASHARSDAEAALRQSRIASAAESANDPLVAALLMSELGDDPPPRAVEVAQRVLRHPIPFAVLEGAPGATSVVVSPDGRHAAAGLRDGTIAVWALDAPGPPLLQRTGGRRINALAFTPDGARLVAASHDGEVKVVQVDGSLPATRWPTADSPIARLRVSPDGRWAAAGSLDGRAWILDLTRRIPARFVLHDGAVSDLAFSADATRLVTASHDGSARIVDPRTGERLATLRVPGGAVFAVALSPNGRVLATASEDGIARLWDPARPDRFDALPAAAPPLTGIAFSPDGASLLVSAGDGTAYVHHLEASGSPVRLRGHREPLTTAAFAPDARVITASLDGTVRVWRADGEGEPLVLRGHGALDAAFTPDGRRILTRGKDGVLRLYDAADPRERGVLRGHDGLVDTVEWTRDGKRIVTAGHDGTARIRAISGTGPSLMIDDPSGILHSADLDPAEERLVTAAEDGAVRVWNARDGALLVELRGHTGPVLSAAFSPDGRRIASASLDRTVRVWNADGRGEPRVLEGHEGGLTSVTFSPDGRWIVSASSLDATVRVWPTEGGSPRVIRAERGVFRASASPDGRLVLAEEDGGVRLFRLDTLEELPPLPIRPEALWAAMFSPDGERLALTSMDGTVRVVRADGLGDPLVLRGHEGPVGHAAFSPDGRLLASTGADGTVRVWTVDWSALRAELRDTTSACLPVEHRIQILGERPELARRRNEACHRAHGRSTLAAPPAAGGDPAARARAGAPGKEG